MKSGLKLPRAILILVFMGLMLGWIYKYFFSPVCGFTYLENPEKVPYSPNYESILITMVLFVVGSILIGLLLWLIEKVFGSTRAPQSENIIDDQAPASKPRKSLGYQFVMGGFVLSAICYTSLLCERLF